MKIRLRPKLFSRDGAGDEEKCKNLDMDRTKGRRRTTEGKDGMTEGRREDGSERWKVGEKQKRRRRSNEGSG